MPRFANVGQHEWKIAPQLNMEGKLIAAITLLWFKPRQSGSNDENDKLSLVFFIES